MRRESTRAGGISTRRSAGRIEPPSRSLLFAFLPLVQGLCFRSRRCDLRRCQRAADAIGLLVGQHPPEDRGELPHRRGAGDPRSPPAFDPLEPGPQRRIFAQHLEDRLSQQPARHAAAGLSDPSQALLVLPAVAAAGRQAPVVRQAPRSREPLHAADPTRERRRRERTDAGGGGQQPSRGARFRPAGDHLFQLGQPLLDQIQVAEQMVELQAIDLGQNTSCRSQAIAVCVGKVLVGNSHCRLWRRSRCLI